MSDGFDAIYPHSFQCLRRSHRQCHLNLQCTVVSCAFYLPFILPDGEVPAFKGEVDHLDDCDRRRAHPEADTAAEIRDELCLL